MRTSFFAVAVVLCLGTGVDAQVPAYYTNPQWSGYQNTGYTPGPVQNEQVNVSNVNVVGTGVNNQMVPVTPTAGRQPDIYVYHRVDFGDTSGPATRILDARDKTVCQPRCTQPCYQQQQPVYYYYYPQQPTYYYPQWSGYQNTGCTGSRLFGW